MKYFKINQWLLATLAAIGFSFAPGARAQATQQPVTISIQDYPGIVGTLARVAIENGYCNKHGLKCVLKTIPAAPLGIQTLLAGDIDVALTSAEVLVQSASKGSELKVITTGAGASTFLLAIGKGMMNVRYNDYRDVMHALKGKKIGVTSRGAAPEFQVKSMLKAAGLKDDDVTFVAVGSPNTAYPALLNQQIDAAMSFVPLDGFCEVLKTCRVAVRISKGEGPKELVALNGAGGLYIMRKDFVAKNPAIGPAFMEAIDDARRFAIDPVNLEKLMEITVKYYRLELPRGTEILRNSLGNFQSSFISQDSKRALQASADYLHSTGQLAKPFDVGSLY